VNIDKTVFVFRLKDSSHRKICNPLYLRSSQVFNPTTHLPRQQ